MKCLYFLKIFIMVYDLIWFIWGLLVYWRVKSKKIILEEFVHLLEINPCWFSYLMNWKLNSLSNEYGWDLRTKMFLGNLNELEQLFYDCYDILVSLSWNWWRKKSNKRAWKTLFLKLQRSERNRRKSASKLHMSFEMKNG